MRRLDGGARRPALQQPVGEPGGEGVAGADLVDHRPRAAPARPRSARRTRTSARRAVRTTTALAAASSAVPQRRAASSAAAQVPVDVLEHRLHGGGRGRRALPQRRAVVGIERDDRAGLPRPPRDVQHQRPRPVPERHRDPGEVHERGARPAPRPARRRAASGSPPSRAGGRRPTSARPRATCRTARSARRRAARTQRTSTPSARSVSWISTPSRSAPSREIHATGTPSRARRDREVRLRAREAQPQPVAELELALPLGIEEGHRLAGGDDAGHPNGARGAAG